MDAIVVVADRDGREVFANRAASVLGQARHNDALVAAAIEKAVEVANSGGSEQRVLDLFGPPRRSLALQADPICDGERIIGCVVTVKDVTELKRLGEVRRDFVANVSHELRTPVGGLVSLADALDEDDVDPDVTRRLIPRIRTEAERLAHIIDDLLDLSRIEAASPERFAQTVDLQDVAEAAAGNVAQAVEEAGVTLDTSATGEVTVAGDRAQLVSAITNLLDNAIKYSPPSSKVQIDIATDDGWATVSVRDQGIGIAAGEQARIFERFYRVDTARSRRTGGTGLGLAIVRHVAVNHGGEVLVDSREGEGSTFTLRLPLRPRHP